MTFNSYRNRELSLAERFWQKVDPHPTPLGCWFWLGAKNPSGHGRFWTGGSPRQAPAHRWLYEQVFGPLRSDQHLDHLCENPSCVNPDHLEPVSLVENLRRSARSLMTINARKTHCPRGHAYDETNTRTSGGRRDCRACARERAREHRRAA